MTPPTASVIIPAYRAQATLPLVMDALEPHIIGKNREVVLVDSTGPDSGINVEQKWPWARAVYVPHRVFPGRARNLGASFAQADVLAFLDADTIPQPGWLDELERALTPEVEAVAGAVLDGTPTKAWGTVGYMLEFLEWVPERVRPLAHAAGCNLLVSRAAFELAGGFPEDLWPGEDTVFSVPFARKGTLAFAPRAQVTHLNRVGARDVLAHQRRLGASWVGVCSRVSLRGDWLGVPYLAPAAVLARLVAVTCQLRRRPVALRPLIRHGPLLVVGLVAWGVGVFRPPRGERRDTKLIEAN